MSLADGGEVALFSVDFIKKCIETYKEEHEGQEPKVLAISESDFVDWSLSTVGWDNVVRDLGLKVVSNKELKAGQIDLALGLVEE